ncbi:FMN-dependent NADH-azoreductase [Neisseria mucosa]|nr:FMN-dependent NADH-azoreductase [Neisseria mucosa]
MVVLQATSSNAVDIAREGISFFISEFIVTKEVVLIMQKGRLKDGRNIHSIPFQTTF